MDKVQNSRSLILSLRFSLYGLAMWFFGNLYEGIVLSPNLLSDTVRKLQIWNQYFTLTNPIFYFVPLTHLAVVAIWVIVLRKKYPSEVGKPLRIAAVSLVIAETVTLFIITQLNLQLFFGSFDPAVTELKVLQWNILNMVRVALVGTATLSVFQAHNKYLMLIPRETIVRRGS